MKLCNETEAFFFNDFELDGLKYRIFNYRLASYGLFCLPHALECRGIMFLLDQNDEPLNIAARPMEKFFNLGENPFTMGLDLSEENIDSVQMKADGSLISSFFHKGDVRFKSKGSLFSDQAQWANEWFQRQPTPVKYDIREAAKMGVTLNFEYVAPHNRIVLNYQEENMILLNIRFNNSGDYMSPTVAKILYPALAPLYVADALDVYKDDTAESLVKDGPSFTDIEGFIFRLKNGLHFKLKTEWYLVQHRAKDSIDSPRRLFEAVIQETTDDLKSLFHDNPYILQKISEMETFGAKIYNHIVDSVEKFVEEHKQLIQQDLRKEFAIAGQKHFTGNEKRFFGLAMQQYNFIRGQGQAVNYKEFCIKHYKDWGLKDDITDGSQE